MGTPHGLENQWCVLHMSSSLAPQNSSLELLTTRSVCPVHGTVFKSSEMSVSSAVQDEDPGSVQE
jgi:hypothetical protein